MAKILVDTCVWIEFFSPRPRMPNEKILKLSELIRDDEVSIIEPIRAELFSGTVLNRKEVESCLDSLEFRDLAWNQRKVWDQLIQIGVLANSKKLPALGLIDRMIVLSALESKDQLWTLDRSLIKLAQSLSVSMF